MERAKWYLHPLLVIEENVYSKPVKETSENESMLSEIVGVIRKRSAHKEKKEQPKAEKPKKASRKKTVESPFINPVAEYLL